MAVRLSASVLKGSCSAIDEATPLHVFGFVMRQLLDGLRSFGVAHGSLLVPPFARRQLLDGLSHLHALGIDRSYAIGIDRTYMIGVDHTYMIGAAAHERAAAAGAKAEPLSEHK